MRFSDQRKSYFRFDIMLIAITHIFCHVLDSIFPILLPVLREEFKLTYSQLGLMISVPPLVRVFASIPCGYLADRFTAKMIISFSFVIQIFSALVIVWSKDPWTLVLSVSSLALASTMYHPAALSYTTKLVSESNRATAIGMQTAGGPLGMALGPLSLSLLLHYSWRFAYIFWVVPIFLLLLFFWKLKPDKKIAKDYVEIRDRDIDRGMVQHKRRPHYLLGLCIFLIYSSVSAMGNRFIGSFISLYFTDIRKLSISETSLILGLVSLTGVIAAPLGGFFSDKLGYKRWLLMVISAATICISLAFLSPITLFFIILYFSYRFFFFTGRPASSSIISKLTPRSKQGIGFALSFLPGSLVGSIVPTLAGLLADQKGLSFLFPLGISIMIASLCFLKFGVKVK